MDRIRSHRHLLGKFYDYPKYRQNAAVIILLSILLIAPVSAGTFSLPNIEEIPGLFSLPGERSSPFLYLDIGSGFSAGVSSDSARNLKESIHNSLLAFRYDKTTGTWSAENPTRDIGIRTTGSGGVILSCVNGSFGMKLSIFSRDNRENLDEHGVTFADGRVLVIPRAEYTEWYLNDDAGIEQGMTLHVRPNGTGRLRVSFDISGDLVPSLSGQTLFLSGNNGPVFAYTGLKAWDAAGRDLPARLILEGNRLSWEIDDSRALYPVRIDPLVSQVQILTSSDGKASDHFGTSIAVNGSTTIVGSPFADVDLSSNQGKAYIYSRDKGGVNNWGQVAILVSSDGAADDCFGQSVAVDESTAVVGSICGGSVHEGQAYIYYRNQGGADNWGQKAILKASDKAAGANFGESVAISGNSVVVGANQADLVGGTDQGQAYVFYRDQGGSDNWGQIAILNASDKASNANFGESVAISGSSVVIGANQADLIGGSGQGQAYIFYRDRGGSDKWGQIAILNASDKHDNDDFGKSVAISGSAVVVGADNADLVGGSNRGQAYVFYWDQGGSHNWGQIAILNASDGTDAAYFGQSVAIDRSTAVVGAPFASSDKNSNGKAYVFSQNKSGTDKWGEEQILQASDREDNAYFGTSVAIDGSTVVGGATEATVAGKTEQGKAYVFMTPTPTPGPTPDGGSEGVPAPAIKDPLKEILVTVSANVGQIGHTNIIRVEVTGVGVKDIIVTATEVHGPGTDVPPPPGIIYEYVDISPARFTRITEANIIFVVPQSWLDEQHLAPQEITLYHNTGKTWQALPTRLDFIRSGEAYYNARSDGFSRFAITGQFNSTLSTQNATTSSTATMYSAPVQVSDSKAPDVFVSPINTAPVTTRTTAPAVPLPPAPGFPFATIVTVGTAGVMLIGGVFMIRRWWIRRQNPALFREYD
ncbi:MAG: PGF-pre-PGF domain-containing protein [Methanoregula sp.]